MRFDSVSGTAYQKARVCVSVCPKDASWFAVGLVDVRQDTRRSVSTPYLICRCVRILGESSTSQLTRAKIGSIGLTIYPICRQSYLLPASNIDSDCVFVLGEGAAIGDA